MNNPRSIVLFFGCTLLLGIAVGLGLGYAVWGIRPAPPPEPYWDDALLAPDQVPPPTTSDEMDPEEEDPLGHLHEELDIWPARHLILSVPGAQLDRATEALLKDLKPGGVLLQSGNVVDRAQIRRLVGEIKDAVGLGTGLADLPLIAIAQEGGAINPLNVENAKSAQDLAAAGDLAQVREAGRQHGALCKELGIALVLAPVLDITGTGASPALAERTFGEDPELVAPLALAFAEGLMDEGVLPVGKHFPGRAAAHEDPQLELAMLLRERQALDHVLFPFRMAAERALPGLLVGHIATPALDAEAPTRPASLSPALIAGILRSEWRYDGVIMSDDMAARAITNGRSPETGVVAALQAGADTVIYTDHTPLNVRVACKAIELAVEEDRLPRDQLFVSTQRLERWQHWLRAPRSLYDDGTSEATPAEDADASVAAVSLIPHVVQPGEHLSGIASQYGTTVEGLRRENNLSGDVLHAGQTLQVPAQSPE